ncbi:MAG: diguanylate cyclase [Halocynthiibacter sp.]
MRGKILIADGTVTNRIVLKAKLLSARYDVEQVECGAMVLEHARHHALKLIILDENLPGIGGGDVVRALKDDPRTAHIPVIVLTSEFNFDRALRILEYGADDYIARPVDGDILLSRIRNVLRTHLRLEEIHMRATMFRELGFAEEKTPFFRPRAAFIVDKRARGERWRGYLPHEMHHDIDVYTPRTIFSALEKNTPEVIVIYDNLVETRDGLHMLSELKAHKATRDCAFLIVSSGDMNVGLGAAYDLGVDTVLTDGFEPQEFMIYMRKLGARVQRIRAHSRIIDKGLRLATIDPLTGLYNRRYVTPYLERLSEGFKGNGQHAAMALDLDHFKKINDKYGHATGDDILVAFAQRLQHHTRSVDLVARTGGEEFLIIMPDTTAAEARLAAERICRAVHDDPFYIPERDLCIPVTVSVGLAFDKKGTYDKESLLKAADGALYRAKEKGRNQVRTAVSAVA